MVAGVAGDVKHEAVWTELGGQLARGIAGIIFVALQAVLNLVRPQLKFSSKLNKLSRLGFSLPLVCIPRSQNPQSPRDP